MKKTKMIWLIVVLVSILGTGGLLYFYLGALGNILLLDGRPMSVRWGGMNFEVYGRWKAMEVEDDKLSFMKFDGMSPIQLLIGKYGYQLDEAVRGMDRLSGDVLSIHAEIGGIKFYQARRVDLFGTAGVELLGEDEARRALRLDIPSRRFAVIFLGLRELSAQDLRRVATSTIVGIEL